MQNKKLIIGWREEISLPKLRVSIIKVKVDTGARTSALHVTDLVFKNKGKVKFAEFNIHPQQRSLKPIIKARAKIFEFRNIKSSNGESGLRPVIKTELKIGKKIKEIELTLVNRDLMGFRMLLGREAIRGDFIVDPGKSFLSGLED